MRLVLVGTATIVVSVLLWVMSLGADELVGSSDLEPTDAKASQREAASSRRATRTSAEDLSEEAEATRESEPRLEILESHDRVRRLLEDFASSTGERQLCSQAMPVATMPVEKLLELAGIDSAALAPEKLTELTNRVAPVNGQIENLRQQYSANYGQTLLKMLDDGYYHTEMESWLKARQNRREERVIGANLSDGRGGRRMFNIFEKDFPLLWQLVEKAKELHLRRVAIAKSFAGGR